MLHPFTKGDGNRFDGLHLRTGTVVKLFDYQIGAKFLSFKGWEQMLVANHGRFSDGKLLDVTRTKFADGKIGVAQADAEVVAQLRSEYALNLLQRASSFLARPGLGMHFKSRGR